MREPLPDFSDNGLTPYENLSYSTCDQGLHSGDKDPLSFEPSSGASADGLRGSPLNSGGIRRKFILRKGGVLPPGRPFLGCNCRSG